MSTLLALALLASEPDARLGSLLFTPEERQQREQVIATPTIDGTLIRNKKVLTLWLDGRTFKPENGKLPALPDKKFTPAEIHKNNIQTNNLSNTEHRENMPHPKKSKNND